MVAIGAGAGMAAVYSVPLGGALFALEVLRGALALRLVMPALAASLVAVKAASFVVPNVPLYTVPAYSDSVGCLPLGGYLFAVHRLVVGCVCPGNRMGRSGPPIRLAAAGRAAGRVRRCRAPFDRLSRAARQRPGCRPASVPASARAIGSGRPLSAPAARNGRFRRERRARGSVHALARRRRADGLGARRALALGLSGRRDRPVCACSAPAQCSLRRRRGRFRRWC